MKLKRKYLLEYIRKLRWMFGDSEISCTSHLRIETAIFRVFRGELIAFERGDTFFEINMDEFNIAHKYIVD